MVSTPRLLLYKPIGTELVNPASSISDQMSIIDRVAAKTLVSNSTAPPVAEFIGHEWFTKDTRKFFMWDGAIWIEILLPTTGGLSAAGRVALSSTNNSTEIFATSAGQEFGTLLHAECNVVTGRTYKVFAHTRVASDGSIVTLNPAYLRLRVSSGAATVTTAGTLIHTSHADVYASSGGIWAYMHKTMLGMWVATFTGPASFGVFLAKTSGQSFTSYQGRSDTNFQYIAVEETTA